MWHETHNGYTQISCECGIPQLIIYLFAVVLTFKSFEAGKPVRCSGRSDRSAHFGHHGRRLQRVYYFLANGYKFTMLVIGTITIAINQILLRFERVPE